VWLLRAKQEEARFHLDRDSGPGVSTIATRSGISREEEGNGRIMATLGSSERKTLPAEADGAVPDRGPYRWVMLSLLWLLYAALAIQRSIAPLVTPFLRISICRTHRWGSSWAHGSSPTSALPSLPER